MYRIGIEYQFEAAHYLTGVSADHKCARLHGHNYVVVVELASETLNECGFVRDYFDIKPIKTFIDCQWDHRLLNEFVDCDTTVENLAKLLYDKFKPEFPDLSSITIKETPTTYCTYSE
jgi:6-pyruvoyltetrahydropterin/6-carboxytetrahydropterin synthase